jgi:hypothetical protein
MSVTAPSQLSRAIRFALSNLSSQNAHHDFEHLCRQIAKRRIASNVIPATGPVAAGGDQGRDFETFRTYLNEELPFAIGFIALVAEGVVVFACTLQGDDLPSKIRADIRAICFQGSPVDRIVVFTAENVPVARRHELQAEARDQHRVDLDIHDGEAISELLADHDLFWIAEAYLHLPAELQPPSLLDDPGLPDWYIALREDWQARDRAPISLGDLLALVRGLRHATFHEEARRDLSGWLGLVERVVHHTPDREVRQRARYEPALATLRGTGTLRPAEQLARDFFAELTLINSPTLLYDASILAQTCEAACGYGATDLTLEEIAGWIADARRRVDMLLAEQPLPNIRAALLEPAAHLALHFDYTGIAARNMRAVPSDEALEAISRVVRAVVENDELPTVPSTARFLDVDAGLGYLSELVELLPQAPMFPVDTLTALFNMLSPALANHARYPTIRDGLDAATASQAGDDAVADHCRQRAMALYRAGRLLDALREFHDAKVNWWHGDTLRNSFLAMVLIAEIYGRIRMPLAAKKYALAVAYGALQASDTSLSELVPRALFLAAGYDHQAGAWITSAETTSVAALAQINFATDPWDSERYPYIQTAVTYQGFTMLAARQHRPALVQPLRQILQTAGFGEFIDFAMTHLPEVPSWEEAEWIARSPDMTAPPFSDAGRERVIRFTALGLRWTIRCRSERRVLLAAEALAAAVQVLMVELALRDPLFLPGEIDVEVQVREPGHSQAPVSKAQPNRSSSRWLVYAPAVTPDDIEREHVRLMSTLVEILIAHTLLPAEKFMAVLEEAFKAGLTHKLEIGRPYQELADLRGSSYRSPADGIDADPLGPDGQFPDRDAPELQPPSHPGPGYTRADALEAVRARYERLPQLLRYTLPRLLVDARTRAIFTELRTEGWKDWHLLSALTNLVINTRVAVRHGTPTWRAAASYKEHFLVELNRPEEPDDPSVAIEAVTRSGLEENLKMSAMSTLRTWGLEIHQPTVDPDAVLKVLGERYGYWSDDVDHEDFFP